MMMITKETILLMSVKYAGSGGEEINILFNKNQTSFGAEL